MRLNSVSFFLIKEKDPLHLKNNIKYQKAFEKIDLLKDLLQELFNVIQNFIRRMFIFFVFKPIKILTYDCHWFESIYFI